MTIPSTPDRRTGENVFAWLAGVGLTGVGVPALLGGSGGARDAALSEVRRVLRTDPEAAAALASHQAVIGALLAGRNARLRDHRIPALARGELWGIWPSSAIDDMLHRGTAAVQVLAVGSGLRLTGPLGRVAFDGRPPTVFLCPVQWSAAHPPGLALVDAEQDGVAVAAPSPPGNGAPHANLVSLDSVFFRAEDLIDADGSRIALMLGLQALHSAVRSWLERSTSVSVPNRCSGSP